MVLLFTIGFIYDQQRAKTVNGKIQKEFLIFEYSLLEYDIITLHYCVIDVNLIIDF